MKILLIYFLLLLSITALAHTTYVSTAAEINGTSWNPGDTIVMTDGTWLDQTISLKADGTESAPIILTAETAGNVILTGNSTLAFSGSYLVVQGLYFIDGTPSGSAVISFRTSSSNQANNCRVTNCAIKNYNPSKNTTDNKWVSLYGENNQVDHCSFENKNNSGTLLVVWLESGKQPNHIIKDNYFGYRKSNLDSNGSELNGQEIIRIGDSSHSMQTANVSVTGNFFDHCDGEIEIISNKSCGNYYSNNIFFECNGMLTLRHGNDCIVEGNYFFGNGVSGSGGVRIIGENHTVYNNYFENLSGNNYRSAICLVRGKENSALNEYYQVKNALVAFNTIVNCTQAFSVNYNSSSSLTLPPIGTTIAHNHVYNETSVSKIAVLLHRDNEDAMDVTWNNNLINKGAIYNLEYADSQIVRDIDPGMQLAGTTPEMFEPAQQTALVDFATTEYEEITTDIRGRERDSLKLPGASQTKGTVTRQIPQKDAVGALFFTSSTGINKFERLGQFKAYTLKNQLITETTFAGNLVVFDLYGRKVLTKEISQGVSNHTVVLNGIYLVGLISQSGEKTFKKVVFQNY
ncbi:MAG: chondroitinase-B domain-containing protein [Prolixibacteraceae bacterium]